MVETFLNSRLHGGFAYFKHSHWTAFAPLDEWIRVRLRFMLRWASVISLLALTPWSGVLAWGWPASVDLRERRAAPLHPEGGLELTSGTRAQRRFQATVEAPGRWWALWLGPDCAPGASATPSASASPGAVRINQRPLDVAPVHGRDGWYYLIAPGVLRAGGNTIEILASAAGPSVSTSSPGGRQRGAIEGGLIELEHTFEIAHFARVFAAPRLLSQPPADPRQALYDALDYQLDLTLDMTQSYLPAAMLTMTARSLDSALQTVVLDLDDNGGLLTVSAVDTGPSGTACAWLHDAAQERLHIDLPAPVPAGDVFTIRVSYSGYPKSSGLYGPAYGRSTHGAGEPIVATLSEPYGARTWWPCKDIPEDKATASVNITCPEGYTAVSNGILTAVTFGEGLQTFHWREDWPLTTYLVSVACTDYSSASAVYTALDGQTTMPVTHFVYPEYYATDGPAVAGTVTILETFAGLFGEYPFLNEKYANASFSFAGGMEHQTCTSLLGGALSSSGLDLLNVHETAHQWFGDAVTMRHFDHLWLNEGFATYCEALFREEREGAAAYHAEVNSWTVIDTYALVGPRADEFFSGIVYHKGGWTLHMLRHVMGDAPFRAALRDYFADPALLYGTAVSADFQAHAEARYGGSLAWFFDEWLVRAGRPSFQWAWRSRPEETTNVACLWVAQTQGGGPYTMPVDVSVTGTGGPAQLRQVFVDRAPQAFKLITSDLAPTAVAWDPDNWVLDNAAQAAFPARALWADASALNFGNAPLGTTVTRTLVVENLGSETLHADAPQLSGADADSFRVTTPSAAFTLAPDVNGRVLVETQFIPAARGTRGATLSISSDGGALSIPLTGTGSKPGSAVTRWRRY